MNVVPLVRAVGWVSVGFGVASLAAPRLVAAVFGFGDRPGMVRALGVRDVVLGTGLARSRDPLPWMRARLAAELGDTALLAEGTRTGAFHRLRSAPGTAFALACVALDVALLRGLQRD